MMAHDSPIFIPYRLDGCTIRTTAMSYLGPVDHSAFGSGRIPSVQNVQLSDSIERLLWYSGGTLGSSYRSDRRKATLALSV
jgi:hypothetical protein